MASKVVSAADIKVSAEAFKFLKLQKGKLEPFAHDFDKWLHAYRTALQLDYDMLAPHLPNFDDNIEQTLDIGSGLGGIDILLYRHYSGLIVPILLDGTNDTPVMTFHRKTYSSARVAEAFHAVNGVSPVAFVDPAMSPMMPLSVPAKLVVSLGSWCFHYAPDVYLQYVLDNTAPGATIITDLRKGKDDWKKQLNDVLSLQSVIHMATKFDRMVFKKP